MTCMCEMPEGMYHYCVGKKRGSSDIDDYLKRLTNKTAITFWMVYGQGKGAPTKQHTSQESAMQEAQRLALKDGGIYYVLKSECQFNTRVLKTEHVEEVQK